jgi:hypothetical protein
MEQSVLDKLMVTKLFKNSVTAYFLHKASKLRRLRTITTITLYPPLPDYQTALLLKAHRFRSFVLLLGAA